MDYPDPDALHPTTRPDLTTVVFLKNQVTSSRISVGDFTYYDDEGWRGPFETTNVLYAYGPQRLTIGKFCAIAPGACFLLAGDHPMIGPSTYPFPMFGGKWSDAALEAYMSLVPQPGDVTVGNDVWIGREARIMPGVSIGDGAVIGAYSVVTRDVAPYMIVAGNPAKPIRTRYEPADVALMLETKWWDWPIDMISQHAAAIMTGTPAELAELAKKRV